MFNVSVRKIVVSSIAIAAPVALSLGASTEAWGGHTVSWEKGNPGTHAGRTVSWEKHAKPAAFKTVSWELGGGKASGNKTVSWE